MRRPVIGITAALETADWAVWRGVEVNISQRTYSVGIGNAGAMPVMLPADEGSAEDPDQVLGLIDGLLLSGGADLDPASYGASPHPATSGFNTERDRFEIALARGAVERGMPVLGICRGMQLLNVACGGDLIQDLGDRDLHIHTPGQFSDHRVRLESGSLAARAMGCEEAEVRSHHHQGVDRLGSGLIATGWAEPGGSVEAFEDPTCDFLLGLLWHPEEDRRSHALGVFAEVAASGVAA